jgi:hypothetical protein
MNSHIFIEVINSKALIKLYLINKVLVCLSWNKLLFIDWIAKKPVKLTGKSNKYLNNQKHNEVIEFKKDRIY